MLHFMSFSLCVCENWTGDIASEHDSSPEANKKKINSHTCTQPTEL